MADYTVNDICMPAAGPLSDIPSISAHRNFPGGLETVHNPRIDIPSTAGDVYAPATRGSGTPSLGGWDRSPEGR